MLLVIVMIRCLKRALGCCLDEMAGKSIDLAILQSRSPSCDVNKVYDGNFSGQKMAGSGLFAQKLKELGYHVVDVEDIKQLEGK